MKRADNTPLKVSVGPQASVPVLDGPAIQVGAVPAVMRGGSPPVSAAERTKEMFDYVLIIRKEGGGLSVTEGECLQDDVIVARKHPADAADGTIERIVRLIERRFLR